MCEVVFNVVATVWKLENSRETHSLPVKEIKDRLERLPCKQESQRVKNLLNTQTLDSYFINYTYFWLSSQNPEKKKKTGCLTMSCNNYYNLKVYLNAIITSQFRKCLKLYYNKKVMKLVALSNSKETMYERERNKSYCNNYIWGEMGTRLFVVILCKLHKCLITLLYTWN